MTDFDVVIVGAGVVGLACAATLSAPGRSVLVVERHGRMGQETSSRNSGVIHAGIYYPPGSLKALTCVEGRTLLYRRCQRDGLPHARCGKLIVATDARECDALRALHGTALANGAGAVTFLDALQVRARAPRVHAVAGLYSPDTGIVDAHALMTSYRAEAASTGALFSFGTEVTACEPTREGLVVVCRGAAGEQTRLETRILVNAAGLYSDRLAAMAGLDVDRLGLRLRPCKGDYFALSPRLRGLCEHLVYPVPTHAGLGVHLTFDLAGQLIAGPDATYVEARDGYGVSAAKAEVFAEALRRYVPEVRPSDLTPHYAGIRPKLQGPGEPFRDFVIEEAVAQGVPGLINLIGIESPGLTASEAIARRVRDLLVDRI